VPDAGPADAREEAGAPRHIGCGTTTCAAPDQFCCLQDGRMPRCEPTVGGVCVVNADRVYCDDRNDCSLQNQICCAMDLPSTSSLADCRMANACNGPKAQHLCDPQNPMSCIGSGNGACRADGQSTIPGYAYCH